MRVGERGPLGFESIRKLVLFTVVLKQLTIKKNFCSNIYELFENEQYSKQPIFPISVFNRLIGYRLLYGF